MKRLRKSSANSILTLKKFIMPGLFIPENVQKYLKKYASGNWKAEYRQGGKFNNIAVIPAIKEHSNIIRLIESLKYCDKKYFSETLFLFVINNTASASAEIKEDNYKTIEYLRGMISSQSDIQAGVIDASTMGLTLPDKDGGVGFARKTGMDIALTLFNYNNGRKKIIICLDADCTVAENYLTRIVDEFNAGNFNAAYVDFEHPLDNEENRAAIICYEIFLRYYVLGLIYSSSPYAIHTIGSTMICDYESYIKVEGMNKKKAAEDFYFMEKLCKNYNIYKINGTKVYPSGRGSWRVPFGTGQRVNRYLAGTQDEYLLYSPDSFNVLKEWLEVFNNSSNKPADKYLLYAKEISKPLYNFLIENKFEESWEKIRSNCANDLQLLKQKRFWFDGFRTLKLIHYLRDNGFPQEEMFSALETMLGRFNRGTGITISGGDLNSIDEQIIYLNRLRELA